MTLQDVSPTSARLEEGADANGAAPETLVESYRRLAEVFHHVLSEQSLDALLHRIADTLADLVPYDDLHIYEADVGRRELIPVLVRGDWEKEVMRTRPAFGQGITGWAVVRRQPVLANQAHLDPRVAFIPGTPTEPEALISIPLVARGALKGALNVYRLGEQGAFSDGEFELAKWFGDAAALAIDNAQVRATLEHQAQTDSLTGLYNHRHFHERLRAELTRATRARDTVALLMLDLDDFKRVNDICGHGVGDQILVAIAEATSSLVRSSDVVCRVGGEEFAVILPSCDGRDALGLARRIMERLESRPIEEAGRVTVSIGIAEGPRHATNPSELVACAEAAMMTAKAQGGDGTLVFSETTGERPERYDPGRDARSIAHLKMLQSVVRRLNRLNSVKEIGEAIVDELRGLIDYHSCRVFLVEGDELVPVAVKGDVAADEEALVLLRLKVGVGVTGHVAATGRSMLIENALECEQAMLIPGTEVVDESVIAVPLRYGSHIRGVVFLSKLGVSQFDENDLRLLEVLAGYASVALENARLYESLRREADHAKAWLEFADATSSADSFEAIAQETVSTTARLLECDVCSLWLQDRRECDFRCVAIGGREDSETSTLVGTRIPRMAGEGLIETAQPPQLLSAEEIEALSKLDPAIARFGPTLLGALDAGYGVRGWLAVSHPAGEDRFVDERLRLLAGLSYRASVALQKALLLRDQQQSLQVANALLEYARALAKAEEPDGIAECVVERAAHILGAPEVSLWLQDERAGPVAPVAVWDEDEDHRTLVLASSLPAAVAEPFSQAPEPFVLTPKDYAEIPGAEQIPRDTDFAVAPFSFDGGRMGFLVAGALPDKSFNDLQLKMLAGLADQAKLAIAGSRVPGRD